MTIVLELSADLEARLKAHAEREGLSPEQYLTAWVEQIPLSDETSGTLPAPDRENIPSAAMRQDPELAKLIARAQGTAVVIPPKRDLGELLAAWRAEDATDDPEELARRDAEHEKLKANLNANRAATGEEPLFLMGARAFGSVTCCR